MTTGTRYTATVTSLTVGWSYTAVHGAAPNLAATVQLVDPLTFSWSFSDAIPGPIDPSRAVVNMVATTADAMPDVAVGHLIRVQLRLGTAGKYLLDTTMRVAAATNELTPRARYAARLSVTLVDLSTDWTAVEPKRVYGPSPVARGRWRERLAELAAQAVVSIGAPTWWDVFDGQAAGLKNYQATLARFLFPGKAGEIVNRLMVSWHPSAIGHTAVTIYAPNGHPTGYGSVGPSSWEGGASYAIPDPNTATRVELVPAARRASGAALGMPLTITSSGGVTAMTPRATSTTDRSVAQLALSASWCVVPATAKRLRDGAFNVIDLVGRVNAENADANGVAITGAYTYNDSFVVTSSNPSDIVTRGRAARRLESESTVAYQYANGTVSYFLGAAYDAMWNAAYSYLSSASALSATWTYDKFRVLLSAIPDAVAPTLAPYLCPRAPGETDGDGRIVRHVTVADLDPRVRFGGQPVTGWVVGGTMTVARGDVVWELQTQPGTPEWTDAAPAAMTVAQLQAQVPTAKVGSVTRRPQTIQDLALVGPA